MPIHEMSFDEGIFLTKQVGYVDHADIRMWANALGNYARNSDVAIMAVVDMLDVDRLCPTMIDVCAALLNTTHVLGLVVVTNAAMTPRNARLLGELKALPGVCLFSTLDKAITFAHSQLHPSIVPYSDQCLMRFALGGIF